MFDKVDDVPIQTYVVGKAVSTHSVVVGGLLEKRLQRDPAIPNKVRREEHEATPIDTLCLDLDHFSRSHYSHQNFSIILLKPTKLVFREFWQQVSWAMIRPDVFSNLECPTTGKRRQYV